MAKFTDGQLLEKMIEELDNECVAEIGDDKEKKSYYHNGQYTDYGMNVKKLKPLNLVK